MRRTLVSCAILAALGAAPALHAEQAPRRVEATTQLPRKMHPVHYEVEITPDAAALAFTGKAAIRIDITSATDRITLNAADMTFSRVLLESPGRSWFQPVAPKATETDASAQTVTFNFGRRLGTGQYVLHLDYTGRIDTQAAGLFALDYDTRSGKRRALYTQFENSDARRMIPSWDEPAHKATFSLSAVVPAAQVAVSNMPVLRSEPLPGGRKRVTFDRSPKMSTYLLFFALGDFERATAMAGKTELGVLTRKGSIGQASYVLGESVRLMEEFNDYFATPYPLPKLDNVAAPGRSQFFGAMENWGAIFTFEHAILLDPAYSSPGDYQLAFQYAAHEIAHQWFGNLVTMSWWDDLWLNEGFASWMESRMTQKLHPEWQAHLDSVNVRDAAMERDALSTTHPVVQRIETVEQASQAFDSITYLKGQAVIHMLENYVGEEAWRDGVRAYMKEHAYSNTVSDDLWRAIEKAARKPVTAVARDFTNQPGVPMIRVQHAACVEGSTRVTLSQEEFTRDRPGKKALSWRVPVLANTLGVAPVRTLVEGGRTEFRVPGCGPLVVNAGQAGYYRTLYNDAAFSALARDFARLDPIDQLGVLGDSWALGMAGQHGADRFLDLANALPLSAQPQAWNKVASVFMDIDDLYQGTGGRRERFAAFARRRLAPVMAQVGWQPREGEGAAVANLRESLVTALGRLGDANVIAEARRRHAAAPTDEHAMPGALSGSIMSVVARHADPATWRALRAAARTEKTPMVKENYYTLLASAADKALARRALELALTDEPGVTTSADMIAAVAQNHPELAFDFALANARQVNERVDASSRTRFIPQLASASAEPETIGKLQAYASANLAPGSRGEADNAAASIAARIAARQQRLPDIDRWLARH